MAIVRWEPVRDFGSLQQEVNRVFSSFFDAEGSGAAPRWNPAMDLDERKDSFLLSADLPGLSEKDISIDVEDDVLTISGSRTIVRDTTAEGGMLRTERGFGSFRRNLTLPEGVDPDGIEASFDRGVLEVRIPKPAKSQPRRVEVAIGQASKTLNASDSREGGSKHNGHGTDARDRDHAAH